MTPGVIIGVGPVKIPEYLDRPQMVTKNKAGVLTFDEFNRWGESLGLGMARLIREDLTATLPGATLTMYPGNPSMTDKYQVVLEVVQLDSELDKNVFLVVQWTIIDVQKAKMVFIKKSAFTQPVLPQTYLGLASTVSTVCASLSAQIAEALGTLKPADPSSQRGSPP